MYQTESTVGVITPSNSFVETFERYIQTWNHILYVLDRHVFHQPGKTTKVELEVPNLWKIWATTKVTSPSTLKNLYSIEKDPSELICCSHFLLFTKSGFPVCIVV